MAKHFIINQSVILGGLEQAIQIKGVDKSNPLLLVIHGGPGCSEMGISATYQFSWEEKYTVVNWDQRFVGKTALLSGSEAKGSFSMRDIMEDAHELCLYLLKEFNKEKLIVLGHSWGTVIGSQLVYHYPELLYGYIGWGQVINMVKNDQVSFEHIKEEASKRNDKKTLKKISKWKGYPLNDSPKEEMIKNLFTLTSIKYSYGYSSVKYPSILKQYRHDHKVAKKNPNYPNKAIRYMYNSTPYLDIMFGDLMKFDLFEYCPNFKVPMLFVFGDNDWQTPFILTKEYLEKINAPIQAFDLVKNSGHATALDNPVDFSKYLIEKAYNLIFTNN